MIEPAATVATATSAVFTDPTAKRGARPLWRRYGVTTGPQAPTSPLVTPPAAPATIVPGSSNLGAPLGRVVSVSDGSGANGSGRLNRTSMRKPTSSRSTLRIGLIVSPSTFASTVT